MDWKKITGDLYKKIAPIRGNLYSQIESDFIRKQKINSVWIKFDMNEFIYEDPFYGESKSTSSEVSLSPLEEIEITHIQELENRIIKDSRTNLKGFFSNSLNFSAPIIKFGEITGDHIEFEMEYCLTNSDSYGMMTGTIDDHIKSSGVIKTNLKIHDMLVLVSKRNEKHDIKRILNSMNPNIYDLNSAKIATDTNVSYDSYSQYRVPYKALKHDLKNKRPWWKIRFN